MSKQVKKTYGRKSKKLDNAGLVDASCNFEEAKLESKRKPIRGAKTSIWAKAATNQVTSKHTEEIRTENADRKRKNVGYGRRQDPFGFDDLDDDILPVDLYMDLSPKKLKKQKITKKPASKLTKDTSDWEDCESTPETSESVAGGSQETLTSETGIESQTQSSTHSDSEEELDMVKKKNTKGSPFKWFLKNNKETLSPRKVEGLRRISVLPTSCMAEEGSEDESIPSPSEEEVFKLPWEMAPATTSLRVKKEEKELFTVVRNTKHANECLEHGESQQFFDDMDDLLDGIQPKNSMSMRSLSTLELASKCTKSAFRMNLRAHGLIPRIFKTLHDAPENQSLALCASAVMFVLTRDRLNIDFDKSILELMLKFLSIEEDPKRTKEWSRLTSKLRDNLRKDNVQGIENLDLNKLTAASLARETFLSLTSQRTGTWFKEEIRLLGGLDHVVDSRFSRAFDEIYQWGEIGKEDIMLNMTPESPQERIGQNFRIEQKVVFQTQYALLLLLQETEHK